MLRIAVDARPLAHPYTGIGRYTESLLRHLVRSGHQWFLYSDRVIAPRFEIDDHVQLRMGGTIPGSPFSLLYSQLVFPRWSRGDCVNIFWSPRHHLPLYLPDSVTGVVTLHDFAWKRFPHTMRPGNRLLERMLMGPSLKRAAGILAVSEFTARELDAEYPECSGRCVVIPGAAALPEAAGETGIELPADPYLLFVGTPEPRKNLETLMRAYARMAARVERRFDLMLVGAGGWGGFDPIAEIEEPGLKRRVRRLGRVSDLELHRIYANARALVFPSLYEGFGLPALEAMLRGVPVIASNRAALPELVGETGMLIDPESVSELADAMQSICQDDALHGELSARARARAERYNWKTSAELTLAALGSIYDARRR